MQWESYAVGGPGSDMFGGCRIDPLVWKRHLGHVVTS